MEYLIQEGDKKPVPFSGSQLQAINEAKRMYTGTKIRIWQKWLPQYSIWLEWVGLTPIEEKLFEYYMKR